ncbi:hypothetical protein GGX14DRAFT_697302 [Mycena pura]|uniref:Uncharacterized protein n=1 Tax=Mycena pura TaxID=153505 RepID=A0AAD6YDT9_9AGAR|nr:hypothetical protein GGX14DRAFT_697302 [Mycena pura]
MSHVDSLSFPPIVLPKTLLVPSHHTRFCSTLPSACEGLTLTLDFLADSYALEWLRPAIFTRRRCTRCTGTGCRSEDALSAVANEAPV